MKMPTTTTSQTPTAQQQQQQQEQQQPATKAEVVPKQAVKEKNDIVPTIVQEKDTKSIEDAKKQAAAKVLKEMAALEDKLAKDVEAAQEKVKRATELEAAQQQQKTSSVASSTTSSAAAAAAAAAASTPTKTSTKNASSVAIFETSDGLRFSKDDDVNTSSPSPSSSSSTATTTAALVVPNIELPRNTRVITDSEDELSEDSLTTIKRRKK
jgi:membrane protein involved in colicin uptake